MCGIVGIWSSRGIGDRETAERNLAAMAARTGRVDNRIWALQFLELWFRMWIDPPSPPARP
ncbi:MAG: hypothetical protein VX741_08190 [Pseudomonadota bacterium]|nr:hypothetical protein [Pseudomonadota bacterium]